MPPSVHNAFLPSRRQHTTLSQSSSFPSWQAPSLFILGLPGRHTGGPQTTCANTLSWHDATIASLPDPRIINNSSNVASLFLLKPQQAHTLIQRMILHHNTRPNPRTHP